MTIYKKRGLQWPVQQSATEQKFRSGLFTVSAEFIRPTGEETLPTEIQTSIGFVDVGDINPTITTGTDGMERIQVIGYAIWNEGAIEERISLTPMKLELKATTVNDCEIIDQIDPYSKVINIFAENIFHHFPNAKLPRAPKANIFAFSNVAGLVNISSEFYDVRTLFGINPDLYSGDFKPQNVNLTTFPQSITRHYHGDVITTEVVYSMLPPVINFGAFYFICPPPP